jgi:hypothetical protein
MGQVMRCDVVVNVMVGLSVYKFAYSISSRAVQRLIFLTR